MSSVTGDSDSDTSRSTKPVDSAYATRAPTPNDNINATRSLIDQLAGQTGIVPDLRPLFQGWPSGVHPHVDAVNAKIDEWLPTVNLPDKIKKAYRKKGNFALVASEFYPDSTVEKLVVIAKYMYWIFAWDDQVDAGGELADDAVGTAALCSETRECVDAALGVELVEFFSERGTVDMLYEPLVEMRAGMSEQGTERLRKDLLTFVDTVELAQKDRAENALPAPEEHLKARVANIAIYPSLTQSEFAMGYSLPVDVYNNVQVKELERLAALLCALINELHSVQKDAKDGQLDNLVLLLAYHGGMTVADAIAEVIEKMKKATAELDEVEKQLMGGSAGSVELKRYVRNAKTIVTGTDLWEMGCGRYFDAGQVLAGGGARFELVFPEV